MTSSYNRLWKLLIDKRMTKQSEKGGGYQPKHFCQNEKGQTRCNGNISKNCNRP